MDKKLQLLETFPVRGDDGNTYIARGYEHLAHLDGMPEGAEHWHATGQVEYWLDTGERIEVDRAGTMKVFGRGMKLERPQAVHH